MVKGIAKKIYTTLFPLWNLRKKDIPKMTVKDFNIQRITAINIEGKTIHTALNILINHFIAMSGKQRTSLRNKLPYVQLIVIDENYMVSPK